MKLLLLLLLLFTFSHAKEIKPFFIIKTKALVMDFVIDKGFMYIANDEGSIEVFDFLSKKIVDEIIIPSLYTNDNQEIKAKITSVDRFNDKTLFVSTSISGFRNVWLHDGYNLKQIISEKDKLSIKEARFLDENNFIFGTLGNEVISYNVNDNYIAYKKHLEQSYLSDMLVSSDKTKVLTSSESGRVTVFDVKTAKILNTYESLNVDKIYKIAYANGVIITAGQDRRVGVYLNNKQAYYLKSDFMVYTAALSPNANLGIYSSGEDGNLQVFDIKTKRKKDLLIGHSSSPTNISFVNKSELFSSGDEKKVFYWKLK